MNEEKTPPAVPNLVDAGFMDARIKAIDIAAFFDRIQRHCQEDDYRVVALKAALPILLSEEPGRARQLLEALSDQSAEPIPAAIIQGAFGAPAPVTDESSNNVTKS